LVSQGNVFATDSILALLVAAPRSVLPWDIVVERVGTKLFLDKREGSRIGEKIYFFVLTNAL
jgi:translation initiation factor 3 subunit D